MNYCSQEVPRTDVQIGPWLAAAAPVGGDRFPVIIPRKTLQPTHTQGASNYLYGKAKNSRMTCLVENASGVPVNSKGTHSHIPGIVD